MPIFIDDILDPNSAIAAMRDGVAAGETAVDFSGANLFNQRGPGFVQAILTNIPPQITSVTFGNEDLYENEIRAGLALLEARDPKLQLIWSNGDEAPENLACMEQRVQTNILRAMARMSDDITISNLFWSELEPQMIPAIGQALAVHALEFLNGGQSTDENDNEHWSSLCELDLEPLRSLFDSLSSTTELIISGEDFFNTFTPDELKYAFSAFKPNIKTLVLESSRLGRSAQEVITAISGLPDTLEEVILERNDLSLLLADKSHIPGFYYQGERLVREALHLRRTMGQTGVFEHSTPTLRDQSVEKMVLGFLQANDARNLSSALPRNQWSFAKILVNRFVKQHFANVYAGLNPTEKSAFLGAVLALDNIDTADPNYFAIMQRFQISAEQKAALIQELKTSFPALQQEVAPWVNAQLPNDKFHFILMFESGMVQQPRQRHGSAPRP
jgi:hypothetical protein